MASRKVPALRTCSHVKVVKLAEGFLSGGPFSRKRIRGEDEESGSYLLHRGVMGVLMGLTRTLSR